jgi:ElaB/YqjD/DUF883 family membrane-anchored ribosome-binding protein
MNTSTTPNGVEQLAASVEQAAESELGKIMQDVETLLSKIAAVSGIDVADLRARVQDKVTAAKISMQAGARHASESAQAVATATDGYVHRSPWQAIGFAALAGVGVGFLLARR